MATTADPDARRNVRLDLALVFPEIRGQASGPDELVAGKPAHQPFQLQDAQRCQHLRGGESGADNQLIDPGGLALELAQEGSFLVAEGQLGRVADGGLVRGGVDLADSGPSSSRMSSTVSTRRAPSRIRRWQPRLARLSTGPGTAKTSRFCSMAWCVVDSDPLRGAASTTTTPRQGRK